MRKKSGFFLNLILTFPILLGINAIYIQNKKQKPIRKYNFREEYLPKLTAQKIIYTHSQITMVGIPKIIYLKKKKKKKKKQQIQPQSSTKIFNTAITS